VRLERDTAMGMGPLTTAERTLASYLLAPPAERGGFEALCARHPELEAELRSVAADWSAVLGDAVPDPVPADFVLKVFDRHGDSLLDENDSAVPLAGDTPLEPLVPEHPRYEVLEELGRGGMGAVFRARDRSLARDLAMKVPLGRGAAGTGSGAPEVSARRLRRFLGEAQITGQLDHPGVVPVHDLGLDGADRVYFTMLLVRGRSLEEIFHLARERREGWSLTRLLGVLQSVGETVAYAHSRGVVHRDLKPDNVLVGRFGEVYVMDWGLAHAGGSSVPGGSEADEVIPIASSRLTRAGAVLGTPAYMPPEQALGLVGALGPRADIYSLGALLYHGLTGQPPFGRAPGSSALADLAAEIASHEPTPVSRLAPRTPGELVSICEKAMARNPADRYADPLELVEDLRAFLDGRPVRASGAGAWAQLWKWGRRNRAFAASLLVGLLAIIAFLLTAMWLERRKTETLRDLSDIQVVEELRVSAEECEGWFVHPLQIDEMLAWLERADSLAARIPEHCGRSNRIARELGRAPSRSGSSAGPTEIPAERLELLWEQKTHDQIVGRFEHLVGEGGTRDRVLSDLDWAHRVYTESIADHAKRWEAAIEEIERSPHYGGLRIHPQVGLVPLGLDPASGLAEFAHLRTARWVNGAFVLPERHEGHFDPAEDLPLIFVLLPGGSACVGAARPEDASPEGCPNVDPQALKDEAPVDVVALAPFFLSKYEITCGQYRRLVGRTPGFGDSEDGAEALPSPTLPQADVGWSEALIPLTRHCLTFPTEAQWEYAARGGTTTVWWTGDEEETLRGAANLCVGDELDPFPGPAPVGSFRPNPFGLYDVHGNVVEYCLDDYGPYYYVAERDTGRRFPTSGQQTARGGSYASPPCQARSAWRGDRGDRGREVGWRPARRLDPGLSLDIP